MEKALGADHPDTKFICGNLERLGNTWSYAGKWVMTL
jgi:hypothetical protein